MEAEEKQADSDFDIDFNLSDEEDFCDKTEPENSHNVGVEDVTKRVRSSSKCSHLCIKTFSYLCLYSHQVLC